jgi:type I restriction enzyme S subunit
MGKYQAYPEYQDSGVLWIGDIPLHWISTKTSRFFKVAMGQTILKEQLIDDGKWPVFSATEGDHYFGRVNNPNVQLDVGDIVIPARGNSIGAVKLVKEKSTTTQTTIYCKQYQIDKIIPGYAYYYFNGGRKNLFRFTQTAIPQITTEEVGSNPILIPTTGEQQKIANFLDHETAKIDTLIEKQQQLIALLKEKRQAVISHAVTKGLNANAPMRDSGVEWLGEVPEHWNEVSRIKYISSLKGRQGWQGLKAEEYLEKGPHVVSSAHFTNHQIQWDACPRVSPDRYERDNNIQLSEGDLLLMKDGAAMGKLAYVDELPGRACLNSHLLLFRPKNQNEVMVYSPRFMYYFMQTEFFQSHIKIYGTGVTFLGISQQAIGNYRLAFPPLSEQQVITEFLERETDKLDKLARKQLSMMFLLQERRTALISAAVTGKIDVRSWIAPEPSDCKNKESVG